MKAAAEAIGVGTTTCFRWLDEPEVKRELSERRTDIRRAVDGELSGAVLDATRLLRQAINNEEEPTIVRVQAAKAVLGHAGRPEKAPLEQSDSVEKVIVNFIDKGRLKGAN